MVVASLFARYDTIVRGMLKFSKGFRVRLDAFFFKMPTFLSHQLKYRIKPFDRGRFRPEPIDQGPELSIRRLAVIRLAIDVRLLRSKKIFESDG